MFEVKLPKSGETMTEATINKWLKQEGDRISKGESLVEIETDKVNLEVEAPDSGFLAEILAEEGETVAIGDVIALIAEKEGEKRNIKEKEKRNVNEDKVMISPAAKRLAKEHSIQISMIEPEGNVVKVADVNKYIESELTVSKEAQADEKKLDRTLGGKISSDEVMPLQGLRKTIAKRMSQSFQESPHVTLTMRVNMERIVKMKEKLSGKGSSISYTDILILVTSRAIENFPAINVSFQGEVIKQKKEINIGLAVQGGDGLVVPVINGANKLRLEEIAKARKNLVSKAKEKKLLSEDMEGGTFTISNLGGYDIDIFTPIINPPESAILGVGKISEEPLVIAGEVKAIPVLWLSLSFDHRVIDGAPAAMFLQHIKELLEEPEQLLL